MYCARSFLSSDRLVYWDFEFVEAWEISWRISLVQDRTSPKMAMERCAGLLALKSWLPPVNLIISSLRKSSRDLQYCSLMEPTVLVSDDEAESDVVVAVDDDDDDDNPDNIDTSMDPVER